MIQLVAEHLIESDLIKPGALVLDLGSRGHHFTDEMRRLGCRVFPIDADVLNEGKAYYHCAISDYTGKAGIVHSADPQATRIESGDDVYCYTLEDFSSMVGVKKWDVIKIDVEGSELEIIRSMGRPLSRSLSIEFHCHTGIYGLPEVLEMVAKLESLGYETVSHDMTEQHGAGLNFWSSLFLLKK